MKNGWPLTSAAQALAINKKNSTTRRLMLTRIYLGHAQFLA
jgi:hypothetical protein